MLVLSFFLQGVVHTAAINWVRGYKCTMYYICCTCNLILLIFFYRIWFILDFKCYLCVHFCILVIVLLYIYYLYYFSYTRLFFIFVAVVVVLVADVKVVVVIVVVIAIILLLLTFHCLCAVNIAIVVVDVDVGLLWFLEVNFEIFNSFVWLCKHYKLHTHTYASRGSR